MNITSSVLHSEAIIRNIKHDDDDDDDHDDHDDGDDDDDDEEEEEEEQEEDAVPACDDNSCKFIPLDCYPGTATYHSIEKLLLQNA